MPSRLCEVALRRRASVSRVESVLSIQFNSTDKISEMRARHVFLHLRNHGSTVIVLQVRSFDFFHLGITEIHSAAPMLAHLKGRQYP